MRRTAAGAFAAAALAAVLVQGPPASTGTTGPVECGVTTLQGSIVFRDGKLSCGPGRPLVLRQDLGAKARPARSGTPILSFVALTDFQLADEESPLRGEFLDKCGDVATKSAFRWNDALLPALIDSEIRAANRIARGPVSGRPFDFAVQLGDASDNQQYNEVRTFIDLLDGGKLVDSDSGADGYEGNQGRDPYPSPVTGRRLLDLANEPFWAQGLRRADGSPLPWFSVAGNHDVKVRGAVPNNDAWKTVARAWVTGNLMINDLPPDQQQRVCASPSTLLDPAFWAELAAKPNTVRIVSADPRRRLLDRSQWIEEHKNTTGLPKGHAGIPCAAAPARACYTVDLPAAIPGEPPVHMIMLDTSADEGTDTGNIDQAQWDWLNADLKKHSACFYPSDSATACDKTGNASSLVVVFSHHTAGTMTNTAPRTDGGTAKTGAELEKLLLRFPNVLMHANGHTHENRIVPHVRATGSGGYFEVNTSSIADWPHQSRTIELVDNHDGTVSIFGVSFDAAAPVDPAAMRWSDDATPERDARFGKTHTGINETYLASVARWVGANDPQSGVIALGAAASEAAAGNVEMILKHPTGGAPRPGGVGAIKTPRVPLPQPRPRFPFPFPYPYPNPSPNPGTVGPVGPAPFGEIPPLAQPPFPSINNPIRTLKGLGAPAKGPALQLREYVMAALAVAGALWLRRSRIRRNQVGL